LVAACTAFIRVALNPPFSNSKHPRIVVPPGLQTSFFNWPGCLPVSRTVLAEPRTVWAANFRARSQGSPSLIPASVRASIMVKMKAGPDPLKI
jgi:hypothetical protein